MKDNIIKCPDDTDSCRMPRYVSTIRRNLRKLKPTEVNSTTEEALKKNMKMKCRVLAGMSERIITHFVRACWFKFRFLAPE